MQKNDFIKRQYLFSHFRARIKQLQVQARTTKNWVINRFARTIQTTSHCFGWIRWIVSNHWRPPQKKSVSNMRYMESGCSRYDWHWCSTKPIGANTKCVGRTIAIVSFVWLHSSRSYRQANVPWIATSPPFIFIGAEYTKSNRPIRCVRHSVNRRSHETVAERARAIDERGVSQVFGHFVWVALNYFEQFAKCIDEIGVLINGSGNIWRVGLLNVIDLPALNIERSDFVGRNRLTLRVVHNHNLWTINTRFCANHVHSIEKGHFHWQILLGIKTSFREKTILLPS